MNKEVTGMIVTFRCDGRVLNYKPGRIYEDVLTPGLEALLRNGTNLTLIDPLSLDKVEEPKPEPKPEKAKKVVVPEPVVEEVSADDSDESSDSPEEYSADSGSDY